MATVPYDETQQFAADSARAFSTVVEGHWDAVFRTLWCMTGNTHDAEELTQETFLKALRAFASFEAGSNVRAWLLRIAVNACHDLRRKRTTSRELPLADDPATSAESPVDRLEIAEQYERLMMAMQELSSTARTVFHLRAGESLAFREIARLLEISEDAARWHMGQARRKLLKSFPAWED